ncbi:MAG: trypco2 family protein [Acidobacteriota bacterium]|nr:trypco2 family protein [Acidobacteriota bacterium]
MSSSTIPLAQVIQELRGQLLTAMEAGKDEKLRLQVKELELELHVGVEKEVTTKGKVGGGIKFWVLSGDVSGELSGRYASQSLQKIRLSLEPKLVDDDEDGDVYLSAH